MGRLVLKDYSLSMFMAKKLWRSEQVAGKKMSEKLHERYCQECFHYKHEIDFVKLKLVNSDRILCTECTRKRTKQAHVRNVIVRRMKRIS